MTRLAVLALAGLALGCRHKNRQAPGPDAGIPPAQAAREADLTWFGAAPITEGPPDPRRDRAALPASMADVVRYRAQGGQPGPLAVPTEALCAGDPEATARVRETLGGAPEADRDGLVAFWAGVYGACPALGWCRRLSDEAEDAGSPLAGVARQAGARCQGATPPAPLDGVAGVVAATIAAEPLDAALYALAALLAPDLDDVSFAIEDGTVRATVGNRRRQIARPTGAALPALIEFVNTLARERARPHRLLLLADGRVASGTADVLLRAIDAGAVTPASP